LPVAEPASERTRIQLCGRLSVEIDGIQLATRLRGKQVPLLLAYLLLNRSRHVGREELIGALWPDQAPRSQDAALRTLLSRLRSALGPEALAGRDELILALPDPVWIDLEAATIELERSQQALAQGDARGAWALAQVPLNIASRGLLPGSQADWLEPRRRELADVQLQALEVVGRSGLRVGGSQLVSAERAARNLIELEQYRESAYVLLMEALAARGNVAEGMQVFDRVRTLLRDELGTNPSPETIAAHERLLQPATHVAEAEPAATQRIELPAELIQYSSRPLIGRLRELSELWSSDGSGHREPGRIVLLAGDPGIGKTRLLAETARRAHEDGAFVLAGRSPQEALVPYQPFVEALRHYVLNIPFAQLPTSAREYGSELARLVPELRRRVPELATKFEGEPETQRYRLFEAVVGLLGEISSTAPVLLILDDLQWADRPSLLLLRHLARSPQSERVFVLGAYRATEAHTDGFADALQALRREQRVTQIRLAGLNERETAELVQTRAGRRPTRSLSRALHAETEGNPLFVEEIVRHLVDSGVQTDRASARELERVGLPEGVKEVIARRLERLDSQSMGWLRTAAVIGRDFDLELLERVAAMDEDDFLSALDVALEAGLVVESLAVPGRYSFSHALVRETLYEGLSAPRRARIHRKVGEALEWRSEEHRPSEPRSEERQLTALALHFARAAGAEDAEKAIEYAARAGEQATELLAYEEAAGHYARALELLERFLPAQQNRRAELLNLLGEVGVRAGDRALAQEAFREAAAIAGEIGDAANLAGAAIGASRRYVQEPGVVDEELIAILERALEMTAGESTLVRVRLLARMCGALYYSPQRDRMHSLSDEAAQIAQALASHEAQAYALAARRRAHWQPTQLADRLHASTELLRCAYEIGNMELELQAHAWLVVDLLEQGDRDAVDAQISAFTDGAQRLRQPLYLWQAAILRAMRSLLAGDLPDADRLAQEALTIGSEAERITAPQYFAIQQLSIAREQGRIAELEQAARQVVQEAPTVPAWRAGLAQLLAESGKLDEARQEFETLAANDFRDLPPDGNWMIAMTLLGELCGLLGDAGRARTLYELLLPFGKLNVVVGIGAVCLGSAERYLGLLAGTAGHDDEAAGHFERAIQANSALQAPVWLAHTQLDLARLRARTGGEAAGLIDAASRTADELELPAVRSRAAALTKQ
jgi:DNA-binding SARP family transcriptional activator/tetratricopeptide (TPR) repeat protein